MTKNRIVFITGGAAGIGFQMAKDFSISGAQVIIGDLNQNKLNAAVDRLAELRLQVDGVICDVTQEKQIEDAYNHILNRFGRIDVLINNAGVQYIAPIEEFPNEKFEYLIKLMLVGPFMTIKSVFPIMKKQKSGRIINMASINGLIGFSGKAAYNSAKHGLIGLTKVAALESAEFGITVNAICPGYVDTDLVRGQLSELAALRHVRKEDILDELFRMIPQKRLLSVEEISNCALFLASEKSAGITGQTLVIDGGYTAQ